MLSFFLLPVAYYSPALTATLLSDGDLHKGLGYAKTEYSGVSHQHYYLPSTWTAVAHHKKTRAKDVVLHGVVRCGKKLTHPIIRPSLDAQDPLATKHTSAAVLRAEDEMFNSVTALRRN
jgi:hypothetical protein